MSAGDGPYPFQVSFEELQSNTAVYVERVFESLESDFLTMPRGSGFVDPEVFSRGYQAIIDATDGFSTLDPERLFQAVCETPIALVVIRAILGFSPPEWADLASVTTGERIDHGWVRGLDRSVRIKPERRIGGAPMQARRIRALITAACELLSQPAPAIGSDQIHRLDKIDTAQGLESLRRVAREGVSYASLLYERYLGRPFASHRDSVSELVGATLESRIARNLAEAGIPYYQTGRAERVDGWVQAPDFFAPDYKEPVAVIEAKVTQDDGTARDKVARVIRLAEIRNQREREGRQSFDVIACISGRGFGVRVADMEALLIATRGKVFTLSQIDEMIDNTRLAELKRTV